MVAVFDVWGEDHDLKEYEPLRNDLAAHVYTDRGELLAPYVV